MNERIKEKDVVASNPSALRATPRDEWVQKAVFGASTSHNGTVKNASATSITAA